MFRVALGLLASAGLLLAAFHNDTAGLWLAAALTVALAITGFFWYPITAGAVLLVTAMFGPVAVLVGSYEHGLGWTGSLALITAASWAGAIAILIHHGARPPRARRTRPASPDSAPSPGQP